ncbi:MAG: hypothetical protein Q9216_005460 [Gyalolechia sp. 2 TL-2023]
MDWRSPIWESSPPQSAVSESLSRGPPSRLGSFSSHYQQQRQQSGRRSVFPNYDESAALASEGTSRGGKRGSQDQSMLAEDATTEFPYMEETGAMRQLHLEDRAPLSLDPALQQYSSSPVIPPDSKLGMKRRASSPPPDSSHDDKALHSAGSSSDLQQRNAAHTHPTNRASPVSRFGPQHGSVSSTSSAGLRNGSYASSGALSVGSSLTSLSSNHDHLSPTSDYPYPQPHPDRDSPYITSHPSPQSSLSHSHPHPPSEKPSPAASRKISSDTPTPRKQNNPPSLQAAMYFCNYERAFHPSTAIPPPSPNQPPPPVDAVAPVDICGYCGKEFSNEPQPDWNDRIAHLTNTHKFGECNQSKKFFRADHFRQHLKHSHHGTSGKWTNMLEGACMKEEPVPEMMAQPASLQQPMQQAIQQQAQLAMLPMQGIQTSPTMQQAMGGAPIANMGVMHGTVPGRPTNTMTQSSTNHETIDEMKDEM